MWSWKDPWWVNVHGQFENGVVFSVTQGFVYGQLSKDKVNNCGLEAIGTKGVVRMKHDFHNVRFEYRGMTHTEDKEGLYGGKKLDALCRRFSEALDSGDPSLLPSARDSVVASEISQSMLDAATLQNPPCVGTREDMDEILAKRRNEEAAT